MGNYNLNELMGNILNLTAQQMSQKLREPEYLSKDYSYIDPFSENDIKDQIKIIASERLPDNLYFTSKSSDSRYPSVQNITCDLVLKNTETKKELMRCEIFRLRRRREDEGRSKQLSKTSRKKIYAELAKLGLYLPDEDIKKYCLVGMFLNPKQLREKGRRMEWIDQQYVDMFLGNNPIILNIPFVQDKEKRAIVNEIKSRLRPLYRDKTEEVKQVNFKLSRISAEAGNEAEGNYVGLFLFEMKDFQLHTLN